MGAYVVVATFLAFFDFVFAVCATDEFGNTRLADVV
jgi:hypothetical protein